MPNAIPPTIVEVAAQRSAAPRLERPVRTMRRDHPHAVVLRRLVRRIAVGRLFADRLLRLRPDHVEVKAVLHQRDIVTIGRLGVDRQRQSLATHDAGILTPLPRRISPILVPSCMCAAASSAGAMVLLLAPSRGGGAPSCRWDGVAEACGTSPRSS